MRRYNVVLIHPPDNPSALALREAAMLLHFSLESLGAASTLQVNKLELDAINILLGYHLLSDPSDLKPYRCIIYQLEQLSDTEGCFDERLHRILQNAEAIWDYSQENIQFLQTKGLQYARLLPMGYHPRLHTIASCAEDIDVLFYGIINPRRHAILAELHKRCRVHLLGGIYGAQRDAFVARSKIVLNIHFYEAKIMEQPRISYLINNQRCVVSEESMIDPFEGLIVTAAYDDLVETCLHYVTNDSARHSATQVSFEQFRNRPMTEYLKHLLD